MTADLSLYLVTDPELCGDRGVVETVSQAVEGGVRVVQVRDKTATEAEIVEQLIAVSRAIDGRALLVVNDRLDAAVAARERGARVDGVHLGQGDASVRRAREVLGPDALIGLTANSAAHLEAVLALPVGTVDYLGVGVIRPTATKPDHPAPLGVDGFRDFVARSPLPCVAIGGVGLDDAEALRDAGAAGIAVVSALCAAEDPAATARAFRRRWLAGSVPRVLSIAGSDPSGGAGIQADIKSIAANGGYGMAVLTALTAQNTQGVRGVHVPPAEFLRDQLDAVSDDIVIDAVKIGMLADAEVIRTVAAWLDRVRPPIVVLDPVMVATSGDRLLQPDAERELRDLLRRATLVTPNLAELAVLSGRDVGDWPEAIAAAEDLSTDVGVAVLVKGGHLAGNDAPDALIDARHGRRQEYSGARIVTSSTHGTGCSLSSALATLLARGLEPEHAVRAARSWLRESLRAGEALRVGRGHGPINHFAGLWERADTTSGVAASEVAASDVPASEVASEWWQRIADIRAQIDELPFIRALADGSLEREPFLSYLAQDALYLREYARVLSEAARRAPTSAEQAFWAHSAHGSIVGELELHASWLTPQQGVSAATFAAEPSAATTAYLDHLRSVAFGGDYAEIVAAVLPCFWLYTDLGRRLHAGEFGEYARDPQHPFASWLATYADPAFEEATETAILYASGAAARADAATRARMSRVFEVSSAHELAFFAAPMEFSPAG
ncbi:bifunctional hydroxymethylpyrimidine kinase/phosphomethylpyrimidine kinase [Microbacterium sp. J1-1]|uniref:bifunctional hydroxymethylpyrimidine kinase/phosphomethylpyrimidine kinase n=1 Tax=Microbacterium sp. J1-1 TaxID=2992441 RepID=UPI002115CCC2|nr:bifunctional hydroxymethylpyrimidine kinase/phosphomethylpyrimidine kinase [Microbacterium sp. J1-1]UUE19437.1 bifunctional hydroxymethylpyrimidine kinase/phosphomethylpyrimidine kinase [Microbacterium sp. J1-1]